MGPRRQPATDDGLVGGRRAVRGAREWAAVHRAAVRRGGVPCGQAPDGAAPRRALAALLCDPPPRSVGSPAFTTQHGMHSRAGRGRAMHRQHTARVPAPAPRRRPPADRPLHVPVAGAAFCMPNYALSFGSSRVSSFYAVALRGRGWGGGGAAWVGSRMGGWVPMLTCTSHLLSVNEGPTAHPAAPPTHLSPVL